MENTTTEVRKLTRETFIGDLNAVQMDKALEAIRLADKLDELERQKNVIKAELRKASDDFNKTRADAEAADPRLKVRRFFLQHIVLFLDDGEGNPVVHSTRS